MSFSFRPLLTVAAIALATPAFAQSPVTTSPATATSPAAPASTSAPAASATTPVAAAPSANKVAAKETTSAKHHANTAKNVGPAKTETTTAK